MKLSPKFIIDFFYIVTMSIEYHFTPTQNNRIARKTQWNVTSSITKVFTFLIFTDMNFAYMKLPQFQRNRYVTSDLILIFRFQIRQRHKWNVMWYDFSHFTIQNPNSKMWSNINFHISDLTVLSACTQTLVYLHYVYFFCLNGPKLHVECENTLQTIFNNLQIANCNLP